MYISQQRHIYTNFSLLLSPCLSDSAVFLSFSSSLTWVYFAKTSHGSIPQINMSKRFFTYFHLSHLALRIPWCVSLVWTVSRWWLTSFPLTSMNWSHLHSPSIFWKGSLHTCAGRYGGYSHAHHLRLFLLSLVLPLGLFLKPNIMRLLALFKKYFHLCCL